MMLTKDENVVEEERYSILGANIEVNDQKSS